MSMKTCFVDFVFAFELILTFTTLQSNECSKTIQVTQRDEWEFIWNSRKILNAEFDFQLK